MFGSKRWPAAALAGGLVALAVLAGCEREPSVASRSAAAFREAQEKGETFEGAAHPEETPSGQDHTAMGGSAADHSAMGHGSAERPEAGGQDGHAGMDHSGMDHGQSPTAPAGRPSEGSATTREATEHAGHGATPPAASPSGGQTPGAHPADHAGHAPSQGNMQPATAVAAPVAVSAGQPAATLRPGPLDAPAATSVVDAQRSAEMAAGMSGGGGHGGHGAGTYRQVDAGRGPGATEGSEKQPPGAGPHQHDPAPPPSGHEGHSHEPPSATANEQAAFYACPMHPEVTSKTPGTCPKCGMALVERRKE